MIYFAIRSKDFNTANYSGGGDYSGSRPRTVIAKLNSQVHLIQSSKGVTVDQLKIDLANLGYSLSSAVYLDGGGSSQMKWNGTSYDLDLQNGSVPFMIKLN